MKKSFAALFKKYRLRSEFATLTELGEVLAQKGLFYEDSIFSHWQKGTRIPTQRNIVIALITIFIQRGGIITLDEANELLESTQQGYLTKNELHTLPLPIKRHDIFQVPNNIINFTGRKKLISEILKDISKEKILFIHGSPGVGKTALAIYLGHVLSQKFSDGVLWYKVDSSRIMDILLSIAATFGENLSTIEDVEIRASVVRSLLANKKVLLILDSADEQRHLQLLLPNSKFCLTIITSRKSYLTITQTYTDIALTPFTGAEVLELFTAIFGKKYAAKNQKLILAIGEKVGNLPLAIHMLAKQLQQSKLSIQRFSEQLEQETVSLKMLSYEDKNLYLAIQISYNSLSEQERRLFVSLGIFEGKDFSIEAVAFVNNVTLNKTETMLTNIAAVSLIESSVQNRYRIHPMIQQFAREKLTDTKIYLAAAKYYETFFAHNETKKNFKAVLKQEADNIIHIFNTCYQLEYWNEVTKLWNPIEKYLDTPQQHNKIRPLTESIETKGRINYLQKILIVCFLGMCIFWILLSISGLKISYWNYLYSFLYSIIPFIGGIIGIIIAKSWGIKKSTIGKAIFYISLGSFFWGTGGLTWAYYNFFANTAVPFPSLADVGYAPSYFLWAIGMIYLSFATGVNIAIKEKTGKFLLITIPVIVLVGSYFLLVEIARKGIIASNYELTLKFFLGVSYPASDVITLTLSLTILGISFKFFGDNYKKSLYTLLFGFAFMYAADFLFAFMTTYNIFYNGSFNDFLFTIGLSFITFGILGFYKHTKLL